MPIETQTTGFAQAIARVREIHQTVSGAPAAPAPGAFSGHLSSAMTAGPATATPAGLATGSPYVSASLGTVPGLPGVAPVAGGGGVGQQIAALATAELGVAEAPPGSNDGARIAEYRTATKGAGVGPWCAYFTSWLAAQAGVPIGHGGSGLGWVPSVKQWAEDTGRYIPAGSGPPRIGDLVVFERNGDGVLDHIGVVTGVSPDGSIQTVEGNSSDKVSARSYGPDGYAGLVRLGTAGA